QLETSRDRGATDRRTADYAGTEPGARDDLAEEPPHARATRDPHRAAGDGSGNLRRGPEANRARRHADGAGLHAGPETDAHLVHAEDGVGAERGLGLGDGGAVNTDQQRGEENGTDHHRAILPQPRATVSLDLRAGSSQLHRLVLV